MRRTKPRAVTYCLGDEEHDAEGRLITAEFATHYGARTHACHVCELAAHAQTGQTDSPPCRQWCACTCPMPGRDSSASTTGSRPGARRRLGPATRVRVRAARGTELCGRLEHCFASSMMWQLRTCQHVITSRMEGPPACPSPAAHVRLGLQGCGVRGVPDRASGQEAGHRRRHAPGSIHKRGVSDAAAILCVPAEQEASGRCVPTRAVRLQP